MSNRDLIGIGASAGGIQALLTLVGELPPDLPAAVLVTIHLHPQFRSSLDDIVSRAGALPATFASEGETYRSGRIYIAPPDRHLLVYGDRLRLGHGARENNSRPAIDPMLRSAAACCGARHRRRIDRNARRRRLRPVGGRTLRRPHGRAGPQ